MTPELIAVIGALGGTLLGVLGTLSSQWISGRNDSARDRLNRRREHLVDVQHAAVEFHAAVAVARDGADHDKGDVKELGTRSATMWATRRALILVGPDSLEAPTRALADAVEHMLWNSFDGYASEHTHDEVRRFEEEVKRVIRREQRALGIEID